MKLVSIKVNGYKNLIDCTYELRDFNVLIGANSSGKSNLLEIFSFLNELLWGSDEAKEIIFNGYTLDNGVFRTLCEGSNGSELSLEIEFIETLDNTVYRYWYGIELQLAELSNVEGTGFAKDKRIISEYFRYKNINSTGKAITIFERRNNEIIKLLNSKIQKIEEVEPLIYIINKIKDIKDGLNREVQRGIDLIGVICKIPVIYNSPNEIREAIDEPLGIIVKKGRIAALPLLEEIKKILKSDKKRYFKEVVADVLEIDIIHEKFGRFEQITMQFQSGLYSDINQLSDGTLIALNIITYLFSNKYPIIAIEELENSLHPKLLQKLIRLFKNDFPDTQIILTTHSPILLNMVQIEDVSVITTGEHGEAKIHRIKDRKDLVKQLQSPFSSFGDIFFLDME